MSTPLIAQFIADWRKSTLNENAAAQSHFLQLCDALEVPRPGQNSASNRHYRFEMPVTRNSTQRSGRADVFYAGHFIWEYKSPGLDLDAAYRQLCDYAPKLDNPPLLIACDFHRFIIHTNFNNVPDQRYEIALEELVDPDKATLLRNAFVNPNLLHPLDEVAGVTAQAADKLSRLLRQVVDAGADANAAARFFMRLVFCLYAESAGQLRHHPIRSLLEKERFNGKGSLQYTPARLANSLTDLFADMYQGGDFGFVMVPHFDGGLFANPEPALLLTGEQIDDLREVVQDTDWSKIEPSIFGTLFEGALAHDQAKRRELGAHYTARQDIHRLLDPVLFDPLRAEWETCCADCDRLAEQLCEPDPNDATQTRVSQVGQDRIAARLRVFLTHLTSLRILDPACGSGNFLYVALNGLLDLEEDVHNAAALRWGLFGFGDDLAVSPDQLLGLDKESFAVLLSRLTVSIGYLQWLSAHISHPFSDPILPDLGQIRQMDAILAFADDGTPVEPEWPKCDVIVGNPPFLGARQMRGPLGPEYVEALRKVYDDRLDPQPDLCCYWFERARHAIEQGRAARAGLIATNSIRQAGNRVVLSRILQTGGIFMAWADEPWPLDGAAVRVSLIAFDNGSQTSRMLDGQPAQNIYADLSAVVDVSQAKRLAENAEIAFIGVQKSGDFEVPEATALEWLNARNPLGRDNHEVLAPYRNGYDVARRPRHMWIIDFGCTRSEEDAALYEKPFAQIKSQVWPQRLHANRKWYRTHYWLHGETRPGMRRAIAGLPRFLVTVGVSKHRVFVWLPAGTLPDHKLVVLAVDDDYSFGILSSRAHAIWSLAQCSWHGKGNAPVYNPSTCFETFPFPRPNDAQRAAVADAAKELDRARSTRLEADPDMTMTKLYNLNPDWLRRLHHTLDLAVLHAYGFPSDISDDDLLARLLDLNHQRYADEHPDETA